MGIVGFILCKLRFKIQNHQVFSPMTIKTSMVMKMTTCRSASREGIATAGTTKRPDTRTWEQRALFPLLLRGEDQPLQPLACNALVEDRLAPLPLAILTRIHDSRSPIATEIGLLSPILLSSPLPPPSRIPSSQSAAPQSSRRPAGLSRETRRAACACARGRPPRSAEDTKGRHASESMAATAE